MNDGKEEVALDLGQDTIDALTKIAADRNETIDETVEYLLRLVIDNAPAAGPD